MPSCFPMTCRSPGWRAGGACGLARRGYTGGRCAPNPPALLAAPNCPASDFSPDGPGWAGSGAAARRPETFADLRPPAAPCGVTSNAVLGRERRTGRCAVAWCTMRRSGSRYTVI
ncbi:hypothetical protein FA95DRAFT_1557710 [Auriscalpium vulgare]|uniref:Uncharacterized protein n=1 Tax=Auriscalpium vulgare TaxID=40419 RepID=A0ACB8RXY0_9AGAM|nr:hypothetical protein FA95DRAFT_1557710 [Auriscalpium vulgare]